MSTDVPSVLQPSSSPTPKSTGSKSKKTLHFIGPIHVLVYDAKDAYWTSVWCAIALGLVNVLIGAVNMAVFIYAATTGDSHAFVCTVAYHFFSVEAILSLNYANGWASPLRRRHRRCVHLVLQICGLCCAVAGTIVGCITHGISTKSHGLAGLITGVLAVLSLISGICNLIKRKKPKNLYTIHASLGLITFIMSTVSLVCSIFTETFRNWSNSSVIVVLFSFVIVYTVFVVVTVFTKCVSGFWN